MLDVAQVPHQMSMLTMLDIHVNLASHGGLVVPADIEEIHDGIGSHGGIHVFTHQIKVEASSHSGLSWATVRKSTQWLCNLHLGSVHAEPCCRTQIGMMKRKLNSHRMTFA